MKIIKKIKELINYFHIREKIKKFILKVKNIKILNNHMILELILLIKKSFYH